MSGRLALRKRRASSEALDETAKRNRQSPECSTSQRSTYLSTSQINLDSDERCGKIIRMQLINFMCHANLSIDFHKRINFLIGSNGSGKSAIVAGLVVGLGSNARVTSRSTSLKKLIRHEQNSLKIEIVISNSGPCPYRPQLYGKNIIVTRTITQSGQSAYVIKNEFGKVISKKFADLQKINLFHNIQVDNPVFVLNQENARALLRDSNPKENYKMFLKATQLDMIADTLNACLEISRRNALESKAQYEKIEILKKELAYKKNRLQALYALEGLKIKLTNKECEKLWLIVKGHESEENEIESELEKREKMSEELRTLLSNKDQVNALLAEQKRSHDNALEAKYNEYNKEKETLMKTKSDYSSARMEYLGTSENIKSINNKISNLEGVIKDLRTNLKKKEDEVANIVELRRRNEIEILQLKDEIERNAAEIKNRQNNLQKDVDNNLSLQERGTEIRMELTSARNKQSHIDKQIQISRSSIKNKISVFGENAAKLHDLVKQLHSAGKFSELPKGPIGYYIDVPNSQYRDIIESQIGANILQAFLVSNNNDRLLLQDIIEKNFENYQPIVIQMKFRKSIYNTDEGRVYPPQGTTLFMDEIQCKDPDIINCLIDRCYIEAVLITESVDIAEKLCSNSENVPQNMRKILVPQYKMEFFPAPKYRMYTLNIRPAKLITIDHQIRLRKLEEEKKEVNMKIEKLEKEANQIFNKLHTENDRINKQRKNLQALENKIIEQKNKLVELNNVEFIDDNFIEILKKDLLEHEQKKDLLNKSILEQNNVLEIHNKKKLEIEEKIKAQSQRIEQIQVDVDEIKKMQQEAQRKIIRSESNFTHIESKLAKIKEDMAEFERKYEALKKITQAAIIDAQKKGERVESGNNLNYLLEEIDNLKAKISAEMQSSDTIEKLEPEISEMEEKLATSLASFQIIYNSAKQLKEALYKRFAKIQKLKGHMIIVLQFTFNRILAMRQYEGSIAVDHKERTLVIKITPRDKQILNAVSNTKSLSGGERSYTTVAFLIALWACLDHPFYFLDEYDVFTDEINREYITSLLLNEGECRPNRQFTFSTPLDTDIGRKNYIKIHKLSEPERD